jgi:hypothetical protein
LHHSRFPSAIVKGILIVGALLPAMLHAQEGSQGLSPPPGTSWGSAPVQGEWESTGEAARDTSQVDTQVSPDQANAQVLMAQQVMAEQSKRMADFMFWQLILGGSLLILAGIAIYYARQIARAAVNSDRKVHPQDVHFTQQRKAKP